MEASALKYQAGIGLHARTPLLRLQSDERLITLLRRGNTGAFEVLVGRYESRLLSFCRHLLGSREDAEDVLQEVLAAAFNAILADERPINVRPWLYRIARNRSLNHLRRTQAIGVDSMDHHLAEHGASTADKVHDRERFRLLVGDIQELPETQRTALVLREMDALAYEQIAEVMETTVSSVKSLLVRARMGLAEAAEARQLSCEDVRMELAEVAEGLLRKPTPLVRRHLKDCHRCAEFRTQLKATNKALAALLPVGPLVVFRKLAFLHLGHSAGAGAGTAAGSTAAGGAGAAIGASGVFGGGSVVSAGMSAVATKAAAGLAAAVIVTAGAVEVDHSTTHHPAAPVAAVPSAASAASIAPARAYSEPASAVPGPATRHVHHRAGAAATRTARATRHGSSAARTTLRATPPRATPTTVAVAAPVTPATPPPTTAATTTTAAPTTSTPGRVQTQTDPTTLPPTTTTPAAPAGTVPPTTVVTTTTTTAPTTPTTPTAAPPTATTPPTTAPPSAPPTTPGPPTTTPPSTGTTPPPTTSTPTPPPTTTPPSPVTGTIPAPTVSTPTAPVP